jgi:hypothetical protein
VQTYSTFADFVASLPEIDLAAGDTIGAFGVAMDGKPFIDPVLSPLEEVSSSPSVTFISARGATGKSAMAVELSARLRAPLWALGADKAVSGDALTARLSAYLTTTNPREGVADAVPVLVVDAMDEARLKVTGLSWDEFMASLVEYARLGVHLVILGRHRTIEDVWYSMIDHFAAVNWYEISHFSWDQQNSYVDLMALGEDASRSEMYELAKGTVLEALNNASTSGLGEEFAGYAPVLDAVARLVRRGENYQKVVADFEDTTTGVGRLQILRRILESLLRREQEKVAPLGEQLGVEASKLYAPEEQIQWVASMLLGDATPSLQWCPTELRAEYTERLAEFLDDHPFRDGDKWASPVFSSFVASQRLETADANLLYGAASTSGLLFEFVATDLPSGSRVIEELHFAALHASILAGQWATSTFVVSIDGTDADGPPESVGAAFVLSQNDREGQRVEVEVMLATPGVLELTSPLVNIDVSFPGEVRVSSNGASIDMGPDVFIRAKTVTMFGDSLQITNDSSSSEEIAGPVVELEILESFDTTANLLGRVRTDELAISAASGVKLSYPWVEYRCELEDSSDDTSPDDRARRFLNKVMNLARKHGRSERAVFLKKLQGRQGLSHDQFQHAVGTLVAKGVAREQGELLIITPEWDRHRFDGKARPGMPSYEEKEEHWKPILLAISQGLR